MLARRIINIIIFLILAEWGFMSYGNITTKEYMINELIIKYKIKDPRVIDAMSLVPREEFVPEDFREQAYEDSPIPIGYDQTISQPFIVAFMTEAAGLTPDSKLLEIGTGCGYQAAILSQICKEVYTIEVIKPLGEEAKKRLKKLGYSNITTRIGDGYKGWPEEAPFDVIIVTAAPEKVPSDLIDQLKAGGKLIIPVGTYSQELKLITKTETGTQEERLLAVRFVPMVNEDRSQ